MKNTGKNRCTFMGRIGDWAIRGEGVHYRRCLKRAEQDGLCREHIGMQSATPLDVTTGGYLSSVLAATRGGVDWRLKIAFACFAFAAAIICAAVWWV